MFWSKPKKEAIAQATAESPYCPLVGGPCIHEKCTFWVHILGKDPQTGNPVDHYDCTFKWLPVLLIENAQQVRQGAAATESFRNEVVKRQDELLSLPTVAKVEKLIE